MSRKTKEVPLQVSHYFRADEATGAKIPVTRNQRGFLIEENCHYGLDTLKALSSFNPREWLEKVQNHLRDHIEELGYPSDRTPNWIKMPGGEWEVQTGPVEIDPKNPPSFALWIGRIGKLTEPLSEARRAAEYLWVINELIGRNHSNDDLWLFCQVQERSYEYRAGGTLNELATAGAKAAKAREAGPRAKKHRSAQVLEVVQRHAEAYWITRSALKNDASNTAAAILSTVNAELRQTGLLPSSRKDLAQTTIAGYLSAVCRGQKNATG